MSSSDHHTQQPPVPVDVHRRQQPRSLRSSNVPGDQIQNRSRQQVKHSTGVTGVADDAVLLQHGNDVVAVLQQPKDRAVLLALPASTAATTAGAVAVVGVRAVVPFAASITEQQQNNNNIRPRDRPHRTTPTTHLPFLCPYDASFAMEKP